MRLKNIFFLGMMLLTAGCKKWIDVAPKTQVRDDKLFSTEKGFKEALNGAYLKMTETGMYGKEMTFGLVDVIGQMYNLTSNAGGSYFEAQNYNYLHQINRPRIDRIWGNSYNVIVNINSLVDHLEKADSSLFQSLNYRIIHGEALGLRAYLHFDLLRLFAPSFTTGADAAGIPYVTTFGKQVTPKIAVKDVVQRILTDLNNAEALLVNDPLLTGEVITTAKDEGYLMNRNLRFNYYAVKALKARVHLWAGQQELALTNAMAVINASAKFPWIIRGNITVADEAMKDRTFSTEHIFALHILKMQDNMRPHLDTTRFNGDRLTANDARMTEQFETGSAGATDFRYLFLQKRYTSPSPAFTFSAKFYQYSGTPVSYQKRMPMLRISEMYYIAAECDPGNAAAYLNTVRQNRGITQPLPSDMTPEELNAEILKEYRKEFVSEGQVFYYYKRKNATTVPGVTGTFNAANYVLPLPQNEIEFGQ
jgi:hypothetical protein